MHRRPTCKPRIRAGHPSLAAGTSRANKDAVGSNTAQGRTKGTSESRSSPLSVSECQGTPSTDLKSSHNIYHRNKSSPPSRIANSPPTIKGVRLFTSPGHK
nr:hypothetical protein Iba_chr01bCG3580 [Ipomoea batatas]GMD41644.1 hypothetical protein Iba_scaffold1303294CG0010 [Ipomoea batatas]